MARFSAPGCILLFSLLSTLALRFTFNVFASAVQNHVEETVSDQVEQSTRWAVLVAGSSGYINYRHQADVCHAYQILREGGLKDENIVVFMYDDVAHSSLNPRPGVIINNPMGKDVYKGVPKDYTGKHVTANNLYAVILGDKNAVKGGSGKVVDSKPNDHIFIFYSDHGGPGVLGMPNLPYVYATDFVDALKKKHELNGFKKMVIYVDSCESGSIFEGLLPKNLSIYAITASNAVESSWGTYCPDFKPRPPPEYDTCIGDLFSVAWMEDSENHNLMNESIKDQFKRVKKRTLNTKHHDLGSHVKDYGTKGIRNEMLYSFLGIGHFHLNASESEFMTSEVVNQRDADLLFKWKMYERVENQTQKREILKDISETMRHRLQQENNIDFIGKQIFGALKGPLILSNVRPSGVALTDDWNCLKIMVRTFESHCGSLTEYGMKHMRAFANICNSGISKEAMEEACIGACEGYSFAKWSPESHGYSA